MDETRAAELVEFCQRLVRTKSYSGQEQDAAAVLDAVGLGDAHVA